MQIIIPMTGAGQRFLDAGYKTIKPLIEVDGKPMIEHVVNLFPGEQNFIFICNTVHLQQTGLRQVLQRIAPHGKIVEIAPHKKGPVYAVCQILDEIADEQEVIVNYCDFGAYWDYNDFLHHTRTRGADGAIAAYKGFHPHMLGKINYAFMRQDKQWMLEIREKQPFTSNRMDEYASDGTYYFKKGTYVKKYFRQLMQENIHLNGEYYVSMVYNLLVRDHLKVSIYEIQHMQQWGTPGELEEYKEWSAYFESLGQPKPVARTWEAVKLIPLAGQGQRFRDAGYALPKPLLPISGKPMIVQAAQALPACTTNVFVCLQSHLQQYNLANSLRCAYPQAQIVPLTGITQGQACTCEKGLDAITSVGNKPLFIGACDNSMEYDEEKLACAAAQADVLVFAFRHQMASMKKPEAYSWLRVSDSGTITQVSAKKPISNTPREDYAVVGAFYFKNVSLFLTCLQYLYRNNIRVNNEFYVDSCVQAAIELGYTVKVFEVDRYICWGTPDDYKTFLAYQSLFHKLSYHPYSLRKDRYVDSRSVADLEKQFYSFQQRYQK